MDSVVGESEEVTPLTGARKGRDTTRESVLTPHSSFSLSSRSISLRRRGSMPAAFPLNVPALRSLETLDLSAGSHLEHVNVTRAFLNDPKSFLRRLT